MYSKKYNIEYNNFKKYLLVGGMNTDLVPGFVKEIESIYYQIKSLYSHGDIIVLSGSGALLYYLHLLGYTDLIEEISEPNDIDFLLLTNEPNSTISIPFIGDHKRKQETHEKSATFENDWIPHLKFKSFDLTIPRNSIKYNQVSNINLLSLDQLKSYYLDDLDVRQSDLKKIQIIDKVINRLNENPRTDIIGQEQIFRLNKVKSQQFPINYESIDKISSNLFNDSPVRETRSISKSLFADSPETPITPVQETRSISKSLFADSPETPKIKTNLFPDSP